MANHASAKKRILQTARKTLVNKSRKNRIRTFIRKIEDEIESGNYDAAREAFLKAEPEIMRGASRGTMHANTASRTVSRLSARVKKIRPSA